MKSIVSVLLLAFALFTVSESFAAPASGRAKEYDWSTADGPLSNVTWKVVDATTVKGIKGLQLFNSATKSIKVGIALASSAANSEITQVIVPAALSSVGAPGAIFYPMDGGYGLRISVLSGDCTAVITSGKLVVDELYN